MIHSGPATPAVNGGATAVCEQRHTDSLSVQTDTPIPSVTQPFYQFKLFGLHTAYSQPIINLIQESTEHVRDLHCYATIGRVVGADDKDVFLPVATPCILTSHGVEFKETLPEDSWAALVPQVLKSARNLWRVRSVGTTTVLECHFQDDTTVLVTPQPFDDKAGVDRVPDGCAEVSTAPTYLRVCRLGSALLYIPKSRFHVRICLIARKVVPEAPSDGSLKVASYVERTSSCWKLFVSSKERKDFSWRLFQTKSMQFPPAPIGIPLETWFESQRSTLHPSCAIRIELEQSDLSSQLLRLTSGRKHGLQRAVNNLLVSAADLATLFHRVWTESADMAVGEPSRVGLPEAYYFPSFLGDIASDVRRHYNMKRVTAAADSQIEALRKLNNEAKRFMISAYVPEHGAVLDLACGHGQDLQKYSHKNLKRFVGIDISEEEIREAVNRMKQGPSKLPNCAWEFHVGNLLEDKGYSVVGNEKFDVVSIQLAIHYFMETAATADALFARIAAHLKPGGVLIGSTGCCETIATRMLSNMTKARPPTDVKMMKTFRPYGFGNSVYRVEFTEDMLKLATGHNLLVDVKPEDNSAGTQEEEPPQYSPYTLTTNGAMLHQRLQTVWGIRYFFHLIEHIDAEEYVVPWQSFCEVAARHDLQFVQHQTFDRLIAQGAKHSPELREWMRRTLTRIRFHEDQAEAFSFYKGFIFSKGEMSYLPPWMRPEQPAKVLLNNISTTTKRLPKPVQPVHLPSPLPSLVSTDPIMSVTGTASPSAGINYLDPVNNPYVAPHQVKSELSAPAGDSGDESVDSSDSSMSSSSSSSTSSSESSSTSSQIVGENTQGGAGGVGIQ